MLFFCRRLQHYCGLILAWFEKIHLRICRSCFFFVFFLFFFLVYFENYNSKVKGDKLVAHQDKPQLTIKIILMI